MMKFKTDWNENDFVNVDDFNRIRANLASISGNEVYRLPPIVDASYIVTADDIDELRGRYEQAALAAGILSDGPSNALDYEVFDPAFFEGNVKVFPRLRWLTFFKGDRNFPAAWELNLYERLCQFIDQYSPRVGEVYIGGASIVTETISIST